MVLGTGTAAFAKDFDQNKNDDNYQYQMKNKKSTHNVRMSFRDMMGNDAQWATQYIADLANRQIFDGYSDGTFHPQNTVTRIEAITAAVRLLGLRDTAETTAKMQTQLNFKDASQVPAWAKTVTLVLNSNTSIYSSNNTVNFVQVTSSSQTQNLNVSSTLNSTTQDSQGKISTISINQVNSNGSVQTSIYTVSPTVSISGDASQLVQNHSILLQGSNQVVSTIVIHFCIC